MSEGLSLVIGGDGLIGSSLLAHLAVQGHDVLATSRREVSGHLLLDLARPLQPEQLPPAIGTAYLLAAITSMAACDDDPAGSRRVNVEQALALAAALQHRGAHVVYVSTNLVLAGDRPHARPDAPPAPLNLYAAQKAEVERALLASGAASVLRITKIAEGLTGLVCGWAKALHRGLPIQPFSDLVCAPIPLRYLIETLARLGELRVHGLYQIGGDRDLSYAEIAATLARHMGADPGLVRPTRSSDAGVRLSANPAHTTLQTHSTEQALGLRPQAAMDALLPVFEYAIGRSGRENGGE